MATATEDYALVEKARQGNREALAQLVERHQAVVYGYLRARLTDPADAEDLTQEVFLRFYTGRVRFDSSIMIRPWLVGVARNLLREHVRKVRRRREVCWAELCLEVEESRAEAANGFDEALDQLPSCLDSLGASARKAIDLRYRSKLRMAEIGNQLKRSEGAVKVLMFRARQALRSCLDNLCQDDTDGQ